MPFLRPNPPEQLTGFGALLWRLRLITVAAIILSPVIALMGAWGGAVEALKELYQGWKDLRNE